MPQFSMGIDPATWPGPDDVDVIQAAERYEASDDYEDDLRDWSTGVDVCDCQRDTFTMTDAYERGFRLWMDRQIP